MSPDLANAMPPTPAPRPVPGGPAIGRPHRLSHHLLDQFRLPRGPLGRLAGHIMSTRASNVQRSQWTVDLLELEPTHRVLEIGFGPGVALERVAGEVTEGEIVGLDHSATMIDVAMKRNASTILDGRMQLLEGRAEEPPIGLGTFDRIFAVNVWQFWGPKQDAVIADLTSRLHQGGILALTVQPRNRGATNSDAVAAGHQLMAQFEAAGLTDHSVELLDLDPVSAVCVRGRR
ncbi:MAG: class I SAM-dependent methyltransferase [Actinomycetia bacterium]|nr:class I SAM-dependent methyltransferase [Actinomycetes bacterium]